MTTPSEPGTLADSTALAAAGGRRASIAFVVRFLCLFGFFIVPWPGFGDAYGSVAGALGNLVLPSGADGGPRLHLERPEGRGWAEAYGTLLGAENPRTGAHVRIPIDLRSLTYTPTAAFAALAVAAPIWTTARGWIVLSSGLALLHGFLVVSVLAPLLLLFSREGPMRLVALEPWARMVLEVFHRSMVSPPGMMYAVPGILFLVLTWLLPERSA